MTFYSSLNNIFVSILSCWLLCPFLLWKTLITLLTFKHWKRSDPPMDESNGNISSLSDHDLYCCERVNSSEKCIPPRNWDFLLVLSSLAKNILKALAQLWRLSTKNSIIFISPQKKIFCSERWVFSTGKILRLKVESRSLRLMLKTFPISQICDGDSPSCCTFRVETILTISCLNFYPRSDYL